MGHLKDQKNLTNGKGWKNVFVGSIKGTTKKITTKAKNIVGGVNVVIKKLKKD
jgi:hypothetical protein|tara:strand:+ start:321 stop:479 length:159 start_codon:yes stop_codon:yes gene_type:complete